VSGQTRAQRIRAIDHERNVVSLAIDKLKRTFVRGNERDVHPNIANGIYQLQSFLDELYAMRSMIVALCDTDGHELAQGETGHSSLCMVCGKVFETEDGGG
jgi:hypothetical protein